MDNAVCEGLAGIFPEDWAFPIESPGQKNYTITHMSYNDTLVRWPGPWAYPRFVCREEKKSCMLLKCIDGLRTRSINTSQLKLQKAKIPVCFTANKSSLHC